MNKPMTTEQFFTKVNDILREKARLPDILDYGLASHSPALMDTYEFDLRSNLDYGGNEGIYLDLWIKQIDIDGNVVERGLGTYKTLCTDDESMHRMADLLADFVIEERRFVEDHMDDFTWRGVDVFPLCDDGKKGMFGYTCCNMDRALKKKDELLLKNSKVIVRDNRTRKEKVYNSPYMADNTKGDSKND